MQFVYLLLYSFFLLPSRGPNDFLFRIALTESIVSVTSDETEQLTLLRIARYESGFRKNVARCEKRGDHGKSLGTYQVQPIESRDTKKACGTLAEQSELALFYIRRSGQACPSNKDADALNMYTSGRCDYGHNASAKRWGGGYLEEFRLIKKGD